MKKHNAAGTESNVKSSLIKLRCFILFCFSPFSVSSGSQWVQTLGGEGGRSCSCSTAQTRGWLCGPGLPSTEKCCLVLNGLPCTEWVGLQELPFKLWKELPCTENIFSNSTQQQLQCATWELSGTSMWTLETPLYMSNAKKSRFCDKSLIFPWQPGLSKFFLALKSFSQSSYTFLPSWGLRNQNYYLFFLPIVFFLLIFGDILLLCHGVATIKTDDSVGRKVPSCKKTFFCSEDLGIAHLQCNDINRDYFYFWQLA